MDFGGKQGYQTGTFMYHISHIT